MSSSSPGPGRGATSSGPREVRLALHAMGTRFELVLPPSGSRNECSRRAAGEAALAVIEECHQQLTAFSPRGLPAQVARLAPGQARRLDQPTFSLLETCLDTWRASDGLFDVSVGEAMERWGFRAASAAFQGDGGGAGAAWSSPPFALDGARSAMTVTRAGVRLDFGGIAKGHAIDLAVEALREAGIIDAFLHGGTSAVAALGEPRPGAAWRVALPLEDEGGVLAIDLRDALLCVSAPHGRMVEGRGHIIDPRMQAPACSPGAMAAVAAPLGAGALADAWTKPLVLLRARPAGMPATLTSIIVGGDGAVPRVDGPASATITRLSPPRESPDDCLSWPPAGSLGATPYTPHPAHAPPPLVRTA